MKKGDWDVGIAIDAIKLSRQLDVVALATGDGDFIPLVEYLQYHGVLVESLAFSETTSAKLIDKADDFIDLSKGKRRFLITPANRNAVRRGVVSRNVRTGSRK